VKHPVPICTIVFDPERSAFGFRCAFPGREPHDAMTSFGSVEATLDWIDPWRERV
jgi:hypothetical protein